MKITGIKKAVGLYRIVGNGDPFSPWYGHIMLDRDNGKVWCDTFYSIGHNEWKEYHSESIIDLVQYIAGKEYRRFGEPKPFAINMKTLKEYAEKACAEWKGED